MEKMMQNSLGGEDNKGFELINLEEDGEGPNVGDGEGLSGTMQYTKKRRMSGSFVQSGENQQNSNKESSLDI